MLSRPLQVAIAGYKLPVGYVVGYVTKIVHAFLFCRGGSGNRPQAGVNVSLSKAL